MSHENRFLREHVLKTAYKMNARFPTDPTHLNTIRGEEKASFKMIEGINHLDHNGNIHHNRMGTLANALFESGAISVYDDCFNTEMLFSEILHGKAVAHQPAMESIVDLFLNGETFPAENSPYKVVFHEHIDTVNRFQLVHVSDPLFDIVYVLNRDPNYRVNSFAAYYFEPHQEVGTDCLNAICRGNIGYRLFYCSAFDSESKITKITETIQSLKILNHIASAFGAEFSLLQYIED